MFLLKEKENIPSSIYELIDMFYEVQVTAFSVSTNKMTVGGFFFFYKTNILYDMKFIKMSVF